jgi:hypothetical protein
LLSGSGNIASPNLYIPGSRFLFFFVFFWNGEEAAAAVVLFFLFSAVAAEL